MTAELCGADARWADYPAQNSARNYPKWYPRERARLKWPIPLSRKSSFLKNDDLRDKGTGHFRRSCTRKHTHVQKI